EFRGLELISEPGVFVPRDSSEYLAEQAVKRLRGRRSPVHVDLATGAGTIALSVANDVPKATVYGTDLSEDAVKLARRNARRLGLKVRFATGDVFGGLPKTIVGTVDVITAHPPYVAMDEVDDLRDEIKDWQLVLPHHAGHARELLRPARVHLVRRRTRVLDRDPAGRERPDLARPGGRLLFAGRRRPCRGERPHARP